MRETENFKLKLPEGADRFSLADMNSNTELLDTLLHAQKENHERVAASRVMMASGSYTGNGTMSKSISTPGFRPSVVLFFHYRKNVHNNTANAGEHGDMGYGFSAWCGEAARNACYYGTYTYYNPEYGGNESMSVYRTTEVKFVVSDGGLSWSAAIPNFGYYDGTAVASPAGNSPIVNNSTTYTYQWVAFGYAVE